MNPITAIDKTPSQPKTQDSPERIREAAQQFESLLIEQILHAMRDSAQMGGIEKDGSADSMMDFAEQEFAKVMAAGGGFGLSRTIVEGLSRSNARQEL